MRRSSSVTWLAIVAPSLLVCGLTTPPSTPRSPAALAVTDRRAILSSALALATSVAAPQNARALFEKEEDPWQKRADKSAAVPYLEFKNLLSSNQIGSVEFGSDGRSIAFLSSADGNVARVLNPPDDPGLLKELYAGNVDVSIREYRFKKQMNSVSWFRELVGDELTDEERYKYKGYKTYRQNMPERSYVPANLITGYDLSRGMKKKEKPKSFFEDLSYFVKNGNGRPAE